MSVTIKQPGTDIEFRQYYNLRWRILRKPWGELEGSEKDEIEDDCIHIIAKYNGKIVGIGRLQLNTEIEAQIRYMAVEPEYEGQGIGKNIVDALEEQARINNRTTIMLNARELAVGFYEKLGYIKTEKTYLLFKSIQHYRMEKILLR